ncbi:hypothetical protein D3C76_1238340 [compost metagenome]
MKRTCGNRVNAAGRGGTRGFFDWACSTEGSVEVQLNNARGSRQMRSTPRSSNRRLSPRSLSPLAKKSSCLTSTASGRCRPSIKPASSGKRCGVKLFDNCNHSGETRSPRGLSSWVKVSAAVSCSRKSPPWLMSPGNLAVKRKCSGMVSAQRCTVLAAGLA